MQAHRLGLVVVFGLYGCAFDWSAPELATSRNADQGAGGSSAAADAAPDQVTVQPVASRTWMAGWTTLMPFRMNNQPHQVAYDTLTGSIRFDAYTANADDVEPVWSSSWNAGFSHFAPYYVRAYPYFVRYNQTSGELYFDTLPQDLHGPATERVHVTDAALSSVVSFSVGADNYLSLYDAHSGAVRFEKINADGSGSTPVWSGSWASGWSDIAVYSVGSQPHMIMYNASSGSMHIEAVQLDGNHTLGSSMLSRGQRVTMLAFSARPYCLVYANDGAASILQLPADGSDAPVVWRGGMLAEATSVASIDKDGKTYALLYDRASGAYRAYMLSLF
jgi:hypothetical protein